ncbi:MAG: sigma-54 dependent transcriptional regulator [Gemmatimonadota bacterium]
MNTSRRVSVLVCDDEELIRWSLSEHLQGEGYATIEVDNGARCLEAVRDHAPALVLLDLKMPERDGLSVLETLRSEGNDVPVIVLTAHGGIESAVTATRLGASAYLTKPFDLVEVGLQVEKVLADDRLQREVQYLRNRQRAGYGEFIGASPRLAPLFEALERLERVDAPTVLVTGESGTGKDVIARAIHVHGPRKDGVFVEVDCASLPEHLIESELFGHERGAFTDAKNTKRGLFELAAGGVVFLDEIGEMKPITQAKLLRAIENRSFRRVGGVASIPLNASLIAATNRDLRREVEQGGFREDLYFRLNVIPIHIPPLRDRTEDVPALVAHFLDRFSRTLGRKVEGASRDAMSLLQSYGWPGNVRELRNLLERVVLLGKSGTVEVDDLPPEMRFRGMARARRTAVHGFTLPEEGVDLEAVERSLVAQALERAAGNQSAAARLLGISRYALRYRMQKFGLA